MRQTRALTVPGSTTRTTSFGVRRALVALVALAVIVWAGIAFAQEAYVGHKLSEQVSDLRRQNAEIAAQNSGYRKDVQALSNGNGNEEEARLNGFAKPNERTYLVTSPSPSPVTSPSPKK
ncbi:MAG TPA: hypothetical protein VJQ08_02550 [Candidatus Dormibacteraeota bacterium]|nr:hypothetical protein [Candidatus Dormibacteraeota bacterium]